MNANPIVANQFSTFEIDSAAEFNSSQGLGSGDRGDASWSSFAALSANQLLASRSLLFIDGRIDDRASLIAGVNLGTEVFVLDPIADAISQITNILLEREGLASVQIVSHGSQGGAVVGE